MASNRFANRTEAGRRLARRLTAYTHRPGVVVLGLPRGGVPVAAEVARALGAPLDVFLVRKLGVPGHSELAMGAIAEGGIKVLDERLIESLGIPRALVEQVAVQEGLELDRRDRLYRGAHRRPDLANRTVIVVDDGLATGATMEAAVTALRQLGPAEVIVAVPVGAPETCERLRHLANAVICAETPTDLQAVGLWYDDFAQTTDEEVATLMTIPEPTRVLKTAVRVPVGRRTLSGDLVIPADPQGIVVFAHGSGSSRHSPRNQYVARSLEQAGFATLLIDLLTAQEDTLDELTGDLRFDIGLLATRLTTIIDWVSEHPSLAKLSVGLFGASTGGGAALVAAAARPARVAAVVSRGGRPDLAGEALAVVTAPTLLIVGGHDEPVIGLNRAAMARMRGTVSLEIVPGATHLFEEPGTLELVAMHAAAWFGRYLVPATRASSRH